MLGFSRSIVVCSAYFQAPNNALINVAYGELGHRVLFCCHRVQRHVHNGYPHFEITGIVCQIYQRLVPNLAPIRNASLIAD